MAAIMSLYSRFGWRTLPLRPKLRGSHIPTRRIEIRSFNGYAPQELPRVRLLRPAVWCMTAVGTVYLGLAAFEVKRDANKFTRYGIKSSPDSYDALARGPVNHYGHFDRRPHQAVKGSALDFWHNLSETEKVIYGNIAINTAIFAACSIPGSMLPVLFNHIPVTGRNYTMFTSMFGHLSGMHLLFNMYCLYNFGPAVAHTPTFNGSGFHLAAFYLSAGTLASMAAQIEAKLPSRRFYAGSGASGALMALISIFALSYPNAQIGIILIPGSVDAQTALSLIAAFEAYGVVFGIPFLKLGHSVHLAGLAIGAAYSYVDKSGRVWDASRRLAFNQMRRLGVV